VEPLTAFGQNLFYRGFDLKNKNVSKYRKEFTSPEEGIASMKSELQILERYEPAIYSNNGEHLKSLDKWSELKDLSVCVCTFLQKDSHSEVMICSIHEFKVKGRSYYEFMIDLHPNAEDYKELCSYLSEHGWEN